MNRYRFELATPADDADLRRVLAETPMPGRVSLSFRREPSYFEAAAVDGRFRQIVAARHLETQRIVGFGARSVAERYVNGAPQAVGYLSNLRLQEGHRNRGLVARGYAFFRKLHGDARTPLYLTTIAQDNQTAIELLTSRRAGLPAYHAAGAFHTFVLGRSKRREPCAGQQSTISVRAAQATDLREALDFWKAQGPRRQYFPCLTADDFFGQGGAFRDLRPADLLLAYRDGVLIGTVAGWDQAAFRQMVVDGYSLPLRWSRPFVNAWAWMRDQPRLPAPGAPLRCLMAALFVVAEDEPACAGALVHALVRQAARGLWDYVLLGLHEADPLIDALGLAGAPAYTTNLYLVCWQDGESLRQALDDRPPYLELGWL
jgi:hypothetical protein